VKQKQTYLVLNKNNIIKSKTILGVLRLKLEDNY